METKTGELKVQSERKYTQTANNLHPAAVVYNNYLDLSYDLDLEVIFHLSKAFYQ